LPLPAVQKVLLALIALGVPLSAIGAIYPTNTWLQVGPVALGLPLAVLALRRWPLSNGAAACMAAFVLLHLLAARWSYSFVPYHDWLGAWGGGEAPAGRNQFDRLVHFLFGLLAILPVAELMLRYGGQTLRMALVFAALFVLAAGGFYEVFEWSLTLTLAPGQAGAYNGEQGDRYDAQKDMAIAALGAALALWPTWLALGRSGEGQRSRQADQSA
jgi:putative membrane protein